MTWMAGYRQEEGPVAVAGGIPHINGRQAVWVSSWIVTIEFRWAFQIACVMMQR